jgi:signal transduction histidine kinase
VHARLTSLLRQASPSQTAGFLAAAACVAVESFLVYVLRQVSSPAPFGVIYLIGVLVVSTVWGLAAGLVTAMVSCLAYTYFHLPPSGHWTVLTGADWVPILVFLTTAVLAAFIADLARTRAMEAEEYRRTADLAADLAHLLLRSENLCSALPAAAQCLAQALDLRYAAIEPEVVPADEHHVALPLRDGSIQIATLLVPVDLPEPALRRLREHVVPSLQNLLSTARSREAVGNALQASFEDLGRVTEEQAALRRVATLVACGAHPSEVFNAVTSEMGRILVAQHIKMFRYESDATMALLSSWDEHGRESFVPVAANVPIKEEVLARRVWRTGKPVRLDRYVGTGQITRYLCERGIRSGVGCPIMVENQLWGTITSFSIAEEQPEATEERMAQFIELLGTAIANAQSRAELTASRARIIAAADETRRRIERDLHDGTQQRLVMLGLELRAAEAIAPPELKAQLSHTVDGLTSAVEDLQEISRGLHPAILSKGGLGPALKALVRRSAVPVELNMCPVCSLPEPIETAVYYTVSEALTNVAKHAHASKVQIDLILHGTSLRLSIRDDGVGGADAGHGSGLIGLKDRVMVLGGEMEINSPVGGGTSLLITIPVKDE